MLKGAHNYRRNSSKSRMPAPAKAAAALQNQIFMERDGWRRRIANRAQIAQELKARFENKSWH